MAQCDARPGRSLLRRTGAPADAAREYEQALLAVEKGLLLMPQDDELMILRGDIYRAADEYSRALQDYTAVLKPGPTRSPPACTAPSCARPAANLPRRWWTSTRRCSMSPARCGWCTGAG